MNNIQVLMPMGGLGSRFAKAGYKTPKPLIEVDGKPMFMKALDSFGSFKNVSFIFVIRKDQNEKYNLQSQILKQLPGAKVSILNQDTRGAVESCLIAEEHIQDNLPIIIADCDIYFESSDYISKIYNAQLTGKPDAILLSFDSSDSRYSYAKLDNSYNVIATAEKIVISNNAILGGYYFNKGSVFKKLSHEFTDNELPQNLKEYYLSHLFNMLIEKSGKIEIAKIDKMHIFGTPEELDKYNSLPKSK